MNRSTAHDPVALVTAAAQPRRPFVRLACTLAIGAIASALAGCYVVPMQADGRPYPGYQCCGPRAMCDRSGKSVVHDRTVRRFQIEPAAARQPTVPSA